MSDSYYKGQPDDESRQQYVNVRIQEFQRGFYEIGKPIPFEILRYTFIGLGLQYDKGLRLRDLERAA